MSLKYEANWTGDSIVRNNQELGSLCNKFRVKQPGLADCPKVQLFAGKVVEKEWLFGPASIRSTKSVIYPCHLFAAQYLARAAFVSICYLLHLVRLRIDVASIASVRIN